MNWIDGKEFAEWQAFNELEPIDDVGRIEAMIATLIAQMTNLLKSSKDYKVYQPSDFMPAWNKPVKTSEDLFDIVVGLNAAMGGKDLRQVEPEERPN